MIEVDITENNKMKGLGLPDDLAAALDTLLREGVQWGATSMKTDRDHLQDFERTLRITREDHRIPRKELRAMHGVYFKGTDTVICHTGTSPNSAAHARLIVGMLMSMPSVIETTARLREAVEIAMTAFLDYEQQHLAKGTPEADAKAASNAELAKAMQAALDWRPGGEA